MFYRETQLAHDIYIKVVLPIRVPSIGQIKLFNHLLYLKPFNYVQKIAILETIQLCANK